MVNKTPDLKHLTPLDPAMCTCANLRKATRVVTQTYDAALHGVGLKATQFTLLATLASQGTLALTQLAQALVMDRTTLTRNLKPLADKGFVRVDQVEDQRVRKISLTGAGKDILTTAMPLWQSAQSHLVASLGHQRWTGLINNLARTVGAVQKR